MYDLSLFVFSDHGLNIKILFVMVVMIGWYSVLILTSNIAIIIVKGAGYCCIFHGISKSDTIINQAC